MVRLKQRELQILDFLLNQENFITYKSISEELNLTERQVRYDLNNVENFLIKNQLDIIKKNHKRGIMVLEKDEVKNKLRLFKQFTTTQEYKYSKKEIQYFILLKLLIADEIVPVSEFEDILFISRTSVLNHLSVIEEQLYSENLSLVHQTRKGYSISGPKIKRYSLFTRALMELINIREIYSFLIDNEKVFSKQAELVLFNLVDIDYLYQALLECQEIEKFIGKVIDDRNYVLLLTIVMKIIKENNEWHFDPIIQNGQKQSEHEALLLNIIGNVKGHSTDNSHNNTTKFLEEIIEYISKAYHVDFTANHSFMTQLKAHIDSMVQRVTQSILVKNPIFHEFVSDYKELFLATKSACENAEKYLDTKIGDQEISFISIYFASEIRRQEDRKEKKAKILIVCVEGLAISQMIMTQIKKIFEYGEVKTLPVREFNREHLNNYDFIITTIDIPDVQSSKILKVNNYLQKKDLEILQQHLSLKLVMKEKKELDKFNLIMKTIRENTSSITNLSKLELDLINILSKGETRVPKKEIRRIHFNETSITKDKTIPTNRWDLAIKIGTSSLIKNELIIKNYEDKIITNLRKFGPYMVVAPGVMIAHAGMEDGVIEDSMWITILPNGININDRFEKPIKLIFTLAFKSKDTHMLVENIAKLALDHEKVEELINLNSNTEIYDLIIATIYS
ncbi:transcriptional antiterminator/mannitol/fructose-specific phosphotransferase system IIA component (Ntr-type) [Neobacillus niacini]|uniref:BglG family transcription antiterminator n=1 Tax=Neobacillus driksii TaxID=3035913 RepID=UPI002783EBAB|nr:BglG family transcription antiterminator [Neobacillus niacini]MDQ0974760.1 transcriptional antiterminator/mannitol/fructose-specific phosphotransferase system IIA component (Ntr-type) [Neobacillus niacini]